MPATAADAVVQVVAGDGVVGAGQHGVGQQRHHHSAEQRHDDIAELAQAAGFLRRAGRQVEQRQHQQDHGHHFHRQLGQRQVRRAETGEGQRHQQAGDAEDDQRDQPLAMEPGGQRPAQRQQDEAERGDAVQLAQRTFTIQPGQRRDTSEHHHRRCQQQEHYIALQRTVLQALRQPLRRTHHTLHLLFEDQLGVHRRQAGIPVEQRLAQHIQEHSAEQRDQAHLQRQVEAVPDRQAVLRQRAVQAGGCGGGQQRRHSEARQHAHQQAEEHQDFHRHLHVARRLVGLLGQVDRFAVEEHVVDETHRIAHREQRGDGR
ncbi:hypothetical protein D3C76_697360 [compost metagenome]